jgi:hypothetical protein
MNFSLLHQRLSARPRRNKLPENQKTKKNIYGRVQLELIRSDCRVLQDRDLMGLRYISPQHDSVTPLRLSSAKHSLAEARTGTSRLSFQDGSNLNSGFLD